MKLTQKQLILIVGIGTLIIAGGLVGIAWNSQKNQITNKELNTSTIANTNIASNANTVINQNTNTSSNTNTAPVEEDVDTSPPKITNVEVVDITMDSATIIWLTNENSTSMIEYGTTEEYELGTLSEDGMVTKHTVPLLNLNKNSIYHFRVKSRDAEENEAVSDDYSFTAYTKYSLKVTKTIGLPYANPVGIASDQENLWLMFGAHNSLDHKLIYYDPNTQEIIRSFDFHNLIETLGTGVYGITWDGSGVWISVSGNTNKLVRVDPETGEILTTWTSPTTLGPSDLSWDGNYIWVSTGTGQVYIVNPASGSSKTFLKKIARDNGVAVRENEVWVGNLFDRNVNVYNKNTGSMIQTITNGFLQNGNFCMHREQIAVVNSAGVKFYSINPLN